MKHVKKVLRKKVLFGDVMAGALIGAAALLIVCGRVNTHQMTEGQAFVAGAELWASAIALLIAAWWTALLTSRPE